MPPLHPRCRCAIIYDEVAEPRVNKPKTNDNNNLQRPSANRGIFAHLEVPMQKRAVVQICRKYGVDISGLRIKIQRSEELLRANFAGMTAYENIGRIDLTPHAFTNEEQLTRTIIHEGCHVKQLRKYGREYAQENVLLMERVAERYEEFYWRIARQKVNG